MFRFPNEEKTIIDDETNSCFLIDQIVIVGLCGGFSTFSSYIMDIVKLIQKKLYIYLVLYIFLSNFVGVFFVYSIVFFRNN